MQHKELVVERYRLIPPGGKLPVSSLPARLRRGYRTTSVKNYSQIYRRLPSDQPSPTLVPGHNAFPVHPTLHRTLTVREAARIQTFPDTMRFIGTRQQQCMLVGNAVPPILAEVFAQALLKAIRGNALRPGYKVDHYELKVSDSR
jgi:DNA (cytosine-5)-methyltransferase 1